MAKSKAPSVLEVVPDLKKGKIKPIYYFFGEDSFNIDAAVKSVENAVGPFISSDFDRETFYSENKNLSDVLSIASSFPFGTGKKLLILKEAEKFKDKKPLKDYAVSPPDFTVLVIIHNGTITNISSEPFKTLSANNFLFESKELKGKALVEWIVTYTESAGKKISYETAQVLIDIVGEERGLIQQQLEKIYTYLGSDKKEINIESIKDITSELKQFNIFDLQNAIGQKDKAKALEVAYNLLSNGSDMVFIVVMLTRYFTGLAKISELKSKNVPDQAAARIVGTHPFYYKDYVKARNLYSDSKLIEVFRALLKADVSIKTTSTDEKTIATILISEIIQ